MAYENVSVSKEEGIGIVTVNRPKALNALNAATLRELSAAFDEMAQAADVRAVVLTGGGDRAFVAGADISEMVGYAPMDAELFAALGQGVMFKIERLPKPVIAAVHGFALGGGCELAMACDIRIASDKLRIGQPEVKLGIPPGFGGTQRLARIVGPGKAKEMIFSGDMYDAAEALRIGLVDRVVPFEKLMEEAKKLARTIASRGEVAVRLSKDAINAGMDVDIESGCMLERKAFGMCFASRDRLEGMKAFLEKREPRFSGK
ncbi:MAG: crotonase [Euryarchaeota archaeon]|nr:crotonase [Euryarchaeota archaeon]